MRNSVIRVVMWASAGFVIAVSWGLYFATADKDIPIGPIVQALSRLTVPADAVVLYFNPGLPVGLTAVVLHNAATYALVGVVVEAIRRRYRPLQISN